MNYWFQYKLVNYQTENLHPSDNAGFGHFASRNPGFHSICFYIADLSYNELNGLFF
jgi:hypothetical protein